MQVTIKQIIIFRLAFFITSVVHGKDNSAVNLDEKHLLELSPPDRLKLRQRNTFRGPYTDQDDPILKRAQQKEATRTGVDLSKFVCRSPACSREAAARLSSWQYQRSQRRFRKAGVVQCNKAHSLIAIQ